MLLADGLPFFAVLAALCVFAFAAGLIDAAVGGGGLIQLPALLNLFPQTPPATLYGTNKVAAVCGTSFAARSFIRRVKIPWSLVLPAAISAFMFSFAGAATVSLIPPGVLRPLILVLLVLMAIYTFWKKDFGKLHKPSRVGRRESAIAIALGGLIGFYDGVFGPGTGSFLIFLFIRFFALDFVHASASAKVVNIATNVASLVFLHSHGQRAVSGCLADGGVQRTGRDIRHLARRAQGLGLRARSFPGPAGRADFQAGLRHTVWLTCRAAGLGTALTHPLLR